MEDNRIIECIERANYILGNLMAVTEKDEVLIVIDDQTDRRMANAMAAPAMAFAMRVPPRAWARSMVFIRCLFAARIRPPFSPSPLS